MKKMEKEEEEEEEKSDRNGGNMVVRWEAYMVMILVSSSLRNGKDALGCFGIVFPCLYGPRRLHYIERTLHSRPDGHQLYFLIFTNKSRCAFLKNYTNDQIL